MIGVARFKGYDPGESFIGTLDPQLEERAVARGSVEIVERGEIRLDLTRATPPRGWDPSEIRLE